MPERHEKSHAPKWASQTKKVVRERLAKGVSDVEIAREVKVPVREVRQFIREAKDVVVAKSCPLCGGPMFFGRNRKPGGECVRCLATSAKMRPAHNPT